MIEFTGVDLCYRRDDASALAIRNLDLRIVAGAVTALVGPSGCGKSSLVKLVAGLLRPTAGVVRIHGELVDGVRPDTGIAFQNATLMPWRTVLQNVLISVEVSKALRAEYRRDAAPFEARARELLRIVGLAGYESARPWELSGGMQQRVSLCRALIHRPAILLLDEPFAALDTFTREELWNVVQDLFLSHRPTIVLITHELREAVYLADRVIVMGRRPGRVVEDVEIALSRPRSATIVFDGGFLAHVQYLRESIARAMK